MAASYSPDSKFVSMRNAVSVIGLLMWFVGQAGAQLLLEDDRVVIGNEVNVNSTDLDFSPAYYRDGVVFVTTHVDELKYKVEDERISTNIMKLYQAYRSFNGVLFEPQIFYRELSSGYHEGPVTFDTGYTKIYFTRNDETDPKRRRRKTLRRLRIYTADLVGDEWTGERLVDFNDDNSNTAHPALAPDGQRLVFASDRDGGYGGMDLWAVDKIGDEWGEPYNLGAAINTDGNDVFPSLHADGTLYFASTTESPDDEEGHLDVYYSRQSGGTWGTGVCLGPPFNSDDDDFGLIVGPDNKKGYFSSNRPGGLGGDDIYSFQIITEREGGPLDLTLDVSNAETGEPIGGAEVKYLNTNDISLARALADGLVSTDEDGVALSGGSSAVTDDSGRRTLRVNAGDFLVSIGRDGYATKQLPISLTQGDLVVPVALEPVKSCANLSVVVLDEATLQPVRDVRVRFSGQGSGSQIDVSTTEQGEAAACLPCDDIYGISGVLGARRTGPGSFDTRGGECARADRTKLTLYLKRGGGVAARPDNALVEGTVLQLPSVYYRYGRWQLSADALSDLNHLGLLMERYPGMRVEIGSHTDARSGRAFNQQLSDRRAAEVKRYLVEELGIGSQRIAARGYGESRVRNRCVDGVRCSEAEHLRNRRTEVTITYVDRPAAVPVAWQAAARQSTEPSTREGTASRASAVASPPVTRSSTGGPSKYWVVAGTFQTDANARRQKAKLEELGYAGVSLTSFDGQAQAVVAGQFSTLAAASEFSRALSEAHRIGAYVRKVRVGP